MNSDSKNRAKDTAVDAGVGLLKVAANAIPGVGGPVASLLDFLPTQHQRRFERFSREVENRVSRLERNVSEDEFGFLFEKAAKVAIGDHRDSKRSVLASILAESFAGHVDLAEDRVLIDLVDRLEDRHVSILGAIPRVSIAQLGDEAIGWIDYPDLQAGVMTAKKGDTSSQVDVFLCAISDLVQSSIVRTKMMDKSAGSFVLGINPTGLMKMQKFKLTALGIRFLRHLREG